MLYMSLLMKQSLINREKIREFNIVNPTTIASSLMVCIDTIKGNNKIFSTLLNTVKVLK